MPFDFPDLPLGTDETGSEITFESIHPNFEFHHLELIQQWVEQVVQLENGNLIALQYIFCDDDYLHQLNMTHLNHDTLTDIITFPYEQFPNIHSDIFISVDRVRENAATFQVSPENELHRVIIHGVLHLCGYPDKSEKEAKIMRMKENEMLALLTQLQS